MSDEQPQPSLAERIKAKLAAQANIPVPVHTTPNRKPPKGGSETAPPKKKGKGKPPEIVPDKPPKQVRMVCGHVINNCPCSACKVEANTKRNAAKKARKAAKAGEPLVGWRKIPEGKRCKSRLPDGSKFESQYHAEHFSWIGTLTIPNPLSPGETLVFRLQHGNHTRMFWLLDDMYRDWLQKQGFPTGVSEKQPGMNRDGTMREEPTVADKILHRLQDFTEELEKSQEEPPKELS